jgi:peptide/nickel transport system substrate-binding protein
MSELPQRRPQCANAFARAPRRALRALLPCLASLVNLVSLVSFISLVSVANGAPLAGSVIIGMQLEPPVLDPTANPAAPITAASVGNVYEGLVQFAADGSVLPLLAESWEVTPDGMTYTFRLRQGVRFHDGRPFAALSAKYSLERALAHDSVNPQKPRLGAVHDIEVLDAHTLRLAAGGILGTRYPTLRV